ncbi:MAG: hypothetical protein QM539_01365 [Alphaproteobacteria bacterium]|nr:hypothetical protein [Alphaproteobacteria bacterium]
MNVRLPKLKQNMSLLKGKHVILYMGGASIDKNALTIAKSYGLGLLTADTQGITNVLAAQKI